MNNAPRQLAVSRVEGRIATVTAKLLPVDPVDGGPPTAGRGADRPRGERDDRRGRGIWRPAGRPVAGCRVTLLPRSSAGATPSCSARPAGCTPTAATAFTSAPTWSAATTASPARYCCGPRRSSPGSTIARKSPRRLGSPGRAGPRPGQSVLGAGNHHGRQRDRPFRCRQPGPADAGGRARSGRRAAGRCQPGRRPAVAVLAGGTPGSLAVSPKSAGTGARPERLDTGRSRPWERRTSSTSWSGGG